MSVKNPEMFGVLTVVYFVQYLSIFTYKFFLVIYVATLIFGHFFLINGVL